MLAIKMGITNKVVVTITQNKSGETPVYYLFSFQHVTSKETVRFFMKNTIVSNNRYDEYTFSEVSDTGTPENPLEGDVVFPYPGQYYYSVYEMGSKVLNPSVARQKLEEGRAYVYENEETVYFNPYISNNEDNSNYVYLK
jgi:hypothetical protein